MPSPGAVCPAIVMFLRFFKVNVPASSILPETLNTIVPPTEFSSSGSDLFSV